MLTLIKILLSGSVLAGNAKAKFQAAKRSALLIAGLAGLSGVLAMVGVSALVAAAYLRLAPAIGTYQAALVLAGALMGCAFLCGLLAIRKVRTVANAKRSRSAGSGLDRTSPPADTDDGGAAAEPSIDSLIRSVQSPVVISALAIGVLVGRQMSRKR